MAKSLKEVLDQCGDLLEQAGLVYVIVVQRAGTKLASAKGNVERAQAAQMLREAADVTEVN